MEWLAPTFLWTVGIGILTLGIAYGDLLLRSKSNTEHISENKSETLSRIEEVRHESKEDRDELKVALEKLSAFHLEHRRETTDRLARIETKIDHLIGGR